MTEYIDWISLIPFVFLLPVLPYIKRPFVGVDVSKFSYGASTTGILLTFYGIWVGLLGFDIQNTEESIPALVNGLKIAFGSSLTGLGTSLIINLFFVSSKDDIESSLEKTVASLEDLKHSFSEFVINSSQAQTESLTSALNKLILELEMGINTETRDTMTKFRTSVEFLRAWQEKYVEEIKLVTEAMDNNAIVTNATSTQLGLTNAALNQLGPLTEQLNVSISTIQRVLPSTRPRKQFTVEEVEKDTPPTGKASEK